MRIRAVVVSLILVLGLSACTAGPTVSEATPTPTPTPTPTSTATATIAPVTVPTDCATIVDSATYEASFGDVPLNDPALLYPDALGAVTPTAPAAGAAPDEALEAATQLRCIWRYPQADISYLLLQIGTVEAGVAADYLASLQLDGYTCDETLDGTRCAIIGTDSQYPVETGHTAFVRDDIVIRVDQANVPTDNLLGAVVARIWQ